MVTYTNPQVGNLQSRIQNLNFGSPNYLTGVTTTTPYFQMGNTMQTYTPQAFNQTAPGDVSSYLGYTPQPYVPTNPQFAQPVPFATPATQGGGGGGQQPAGDAAGNAPHHGADAGQPALPRGHRQLLPDEVPGGAGRGSHDEPPRRHGRRGGLPRGPSGERTPLSHREKERTHEPRRRRTG